MFPFCCCEQKGEHEPKQNAARNKYSVALLVQDVCSGLPVKRSAVLRHDPAIRPSFTARVVGVHGGTTLLRPRSAKPFPSPPLRLCGKIFIAEAQRRRGENVGTILEILPRRSGRRAPGWSAILHRRTISPRGSTQGRHRVAASRLQKIVSRCGRVFKVGARIKLSQEQLWSRFQKHFSDCPSLKASHCSRI